MNNNIIKNIHIHVCMEWGAVAYLTHSKYGRCTGGESSTCAEVTINSRSSCTTGYSNSTSNPYTTANGQLASTTGNIYGVYDMSGGAYEMVMGNMSSESGSYTYKENDAGGNYIYNGNEKYLTTYAYGTSGSNQTAYNRGRLGDATSEVATATAGNGELGSAWGSDSTNFPYTNGYWFKRGGSYADGSDTGVFSFGLSSGGLSWSDPNSYRGALVVFTS